MLSTTNNTFSRLLTGFLVVLASATCTVSVHARQSSGLPESEQIHVTELPVQGKTTYQKILQGGPFPHGKDGTVFGNRERLLPPRQRGYYREYTVATPGARNRGARRIVCGGVKPTVPDGCFYTSDHYASFRRIVE